MASTATIAHGTFQGKLTLDRPKGPVGVPVTLDGQDLPANTAVQLVWETYDAEWVIEQLEDGIDWEKFRGLSFTDRTEILGETTTDGDGRLQYVFRVPEDYGGMHDLYLVVAESGQPLNKVGFRVEVSAEISPESGPLGTPIGVAVYGLNPAHPFEGWYQLIYDNQYVGSLTAVKTRGTAYAEIPATGHAGTHVIEAKCNAFAFPYLQIDVSPYRHLHRPTLTFELTDGEPVLPPPIQEQIQPERLNHTPSSAESDQPQIWTEYAEVPSRTAIRVFGQNCPPETELTLHWLDVSGDRVTEVRPGTFGTGFSEYRRELGNITSDAEGRFSTTVVPESVQGGAHPIELWHGDQRVAYTFVVVSRRAYPLSQKAGPVGSKIAVEIDGVGWTEHENEVAITYDNSYLGYGCGADLMGKVVPKFRATGRPGYHFIDVYPTFRNPPSDDPDWTKPDFFQKPMLNWRDHPHGFRFRYAFYVEEGD